ncbi:tetratricopeptide repeat protein [Nocardia sp. NPDC055321]
MDNAGISDTKRLANTYREAGRLAEAIELYERDLVDHIRELGEDHFPTMAARHTLAYACWEAGRLAEAIDLFEQGLAADVRVGVSDRTTLITRNNLAKIHCEAGRLTEGIDRFARVLIDHERVLGVNHPRTLDTRRDLAAALDSAGRCEEATAVRNGL